MNGIKRWFPTAILLVATVPTSLRADELIDNGGFENGTYSASATDSTQNPTTIFSSTVPVGWTPNYAFALNQVSNAATPTIAHDGSFSLSIGDPDNEIIPAVSQTFADVAGDTYSGSFWALDGGAGSDPDSYLILSIDGTVQHSLNQYDSTWTEFTFSFTGTGSDTLQIEGQTNSSAWFVDDVSVTGAEPVVPEPSSFLLLGTGSVALARIVRRKIGRRA
jgi:hypothetical protein